MTETSYAGATETVGRRRAPGADSDRPTRELTPGILEAIGYAGDQAERADHALSDRLGNAIANLEDRLRPLVRQLPPRDPSPETVRGRTGPASDESSIAAQQVASIGHRTASTHDRIVELAQRLDELAASVDLA